jgi:hypothetical protein
MLTANRMLDKIMNQAVAILLRALRKEGEDVMRGKQWMVLLVALVLAVFAGVGQAGIITGVVNGPDSAFNIDLSFQNWTLIPPNSVTSLTLDGGSAVGPNTPQGLVWDSVFNVVPPSGGTASASFSPDHSQVTFSFTSFNGAFNYDTFSFSVDPDTPGNSDFGAIVSDLIGTNVYANFANGSSYAAHFIDNPLRGQGLFLWPGAAAPVPEPGTMMLLGSGLIGMAIWGRKTFRK